MSVVAVGYDGTGLDGGMGAVDTGGQGCRVRGEGERRSIPLWNTDNIAVPVYSFVNVLSWSWVHLRHPRCRLVRASVPFDLATGGA